MTQAILPREGRHVGTWGIARLSETVEHGQHNGYMIMCRRHTNSWDLDGAPQCQRHLALGTVAATCLSNEECMRRLKRWFITGNQPAMEATWPADRQRLMHQKSCGGYRLKDFASSTPEWQHVTDEDLNEMCAAINE